MALNRFSQDLEVLRPDILVRVNVPHDGPITGAAFHVQDIVDAEDALVEAYDVERNPP
jgi:hypothetical protein